MYIPDFSITNKLLKTIGDIEKNIGIIEGIKLLPFSQKILIKENLEKKVYNLCLIEDINFSLIDVKRHLDSVSPHLNNNLLNIIGLVEDIEDLSKIKSLWIKRIKLTNEKISSDKNTFRVRKLLNRVNPDEILARITPITDWLNSADAKNTHPIIVSAILLADFENIHPFESNSKITNHILSDMYLYQNNYKIVAQTPYQEGLAVLTFRYNELLNYLKESNDYTEWIEFYAENVANYLNILREKYQLLEKETKERNIPNLEKLTPRQQKIYQYLLDYKFIQNSDFPKLVPGVSEDSILRDLRSLLDLGMITKSGKTKSSKYEIKH